MAFGLASNAKELSAFAGSAGPGCSTAISGRRDQPDRVDDGADCSHDQHDRIHQVVVRSGARAALFDGMPMNPQGRLFAEIQMNQNLLNVTFKNLGIVQADED